MVWQCYTEGHDLFQGKIFADDNTWSWSDL